METDLMNQFSVFTQSVLVVFGLADSASKQVSNLSLLHAACADAAKTDTRRTVYTAWDNVEVFISVRDRGLVTHKNWSLF